MTIKGKAYIVGAYEHPLRKAPDKSVAQLHAEVAKGALEDAGLTKDDIDGYFCAGDAPGANIWSMANYMNLKQLRHVDSTDMGGCSYLVHVAHAAEAIALYRSFGFADTGPYCHNPIAGALFLALELRPPDGTGANKADPV